MAAPLFSKIASYALRKSGINPDVPTETNLSKVIIPANKKTEIVDKIVNIEDQNSENPKTELTEVVPYLKTLSLREVISIASEEKINVKFVGSGTVESTYPEQGQPLNESREITVILK